MKNILLLLALSCLTSSFCFAQIIEAPTDKQMQALDKFMAPFRKKVQDVLEADKTGQYKTYQTELEAFSKAKDPQEEQELADKLTRDHYAFIKKAYTKAVINHEEMKRGIGQILGHNKFTLDEFGGIHSESFLPIGPLPTKFDTELTSPYEASQHEANINLIGEDCSATVNTDQIHLRSGALFDGGCRSKGSLGDKFDLPARTFQKITLSAQIDFDYRGYAYSIAGYSKVETKIGVRLQGPGFDKTVIVRERWAVAPFIWYAQYNEGINNFMAQNTFTGSFAGGNTFTAQVYNEAHAVAISPLSSSSESKCNTTAIDFIKVSAKE